METQNIGNQIPNNNSTQPTTIVTPTKSSKSFLWFSLGILLTLIIMGIGYFIYKNQTNTSMQPLPTPIANSIPTPDPIANWKSYTSKRCGFSIKIPQEFTAEETKLVAGNDNPNIDYGCIQITAPDYKIVGDSPEGMWLNINRTILGTTSFNSIIINSPSDYVKYINAFTQPNGAVSESKEKSYGQNNGIYFISNMMLSNSNFVFNSNNFIFNISWPYNSSSKYTTYTDQILSTLKIIQ